MLNTLKNYGLFWKSCNPATQNSNLRFLNDWFMRAGEECGTLTCLKKGGKIFGKLTLFYFLMKNKMLNCSLSIYSSDLFVVCFRFSCLNQ